MERFHGIHAGRLLGSKHQRDVRPDQARPENSRSGFPVERQVMTGIGTAFSLTFDRLVSHPGSRLMLEAPDGGQRELPPRLAARPGTLYASAGHLDPGDYTLAWAASSPGEVDLSGRITLPIGDGR
jgi:hypothetical protein